MGCCFASNKIHHENENMPVKIEIVDNKTKIYLKIMPWPKIQYKYLYYC